MKISKIKINNSILFFLILIAALFRGSALSICVDISKFEFLAITLLFCIFLFKYKGIIYFSQIKRNIVPVFLILCAIPSLIANWSRVGIEQWWSYFFAILFAFFIVLIEEKERILETFVKVMLFFEIFSLICYTAFVIFKLPTDWMPLMTKITDASIKYKTLLFYNIWTTEFTRNCGPFWEPSIYAAYLTFALIIKCFWLKHGNTYRRDCIILILTIISTASTGGYILLMFVACMLLWKKGKKSIIAAVITIIGVTVMVVFGQSIMDWLLTINYDIFIKIADFKTIGTTTTRFVSFWSNLAIWAEHPFLGVGLADIDSHYSFWKVIIGTKELNAAQTSTSTMFLAAFGILGIYHTYAWLKVTAIAKQLSFMQKVLFGVIIFFILNQTPHISFIYTNLLLFVLLKKTRTNEKTDLKERNYTFSYYRKNEKNFVNTKTMTAQDKKKYLENKL